MARAKYMVFDIESLPDEQAFVTVNPPPEGVPAAEAVDRWMTEQEQTGESNFLPVSQQRPLSIGVCLVDPRLELLDVIDVSDEQDDPETVSRRFWSGWKRQGCPTFVTYNGRSFDMPLMEYQAFQYGIDDAGPWFAPKPGGGYAQNRNRYNTQAHFDVQEFLSNFGSGRISGGLNLFARRIGGAGKMGIDGSQVYREYRNGNRGRIIAYGQTDAVDTYLILLRIKRLTGEISSDQEWGLRHQAVQLLTRHPNPVLQKYAQLVQDRPRV